MCCTWITGNTGRKKSPSAHHRTTLSGYVFATKAYIDNWKKNLLNSNISSTCPHNMVNFGILAAEIGSVVWGTQRISTGFRSWFRYCSDVAHRRPTKLCTMFGRLLSWYMIWYIFGGLLPSDGILPGAKLSLRPSLAFSYIGSITAQYSSSGREPNFAAWYKEWNYRTFAEGTFHIRLGGHHVGHRPTF